MIITLKGANFASSNIGTLDSWLISKSLTGVTIDNTATSVKKGEAYKAVITLKENYTFPDTITVTMGGTDITSTYVTKTATTITINVPSVTGNIVIRVNAISVGTSTDQYTVTYNLKGVRSGNTTTAVNKESTYVSKIAVLTNSALTSTPAVSYTITMGGTQLTVDTDYTISNIGSYEKLLTIEKVTGDLIINIEAVHSTPSSTGLEAGKWPNPRQSVGSAIQYYPTITSDSSTLMYMTIPSNVHVYTYMNNVRITGTSEYSSIVLRPSASDTVIEYYTFNNSSRGHHFKSYSYETQLYYHSSVLTTSYMYPADTSTLVTYTITAYPSTATINVNNSGSSIPLARANGTLTFTAPAGTTITYGVGLEGYTAQSETITLTQSGTNSKVVTLVKEETGGDVIEPDTPSYFDITTQGTEKGSIKDSVINIPDSTSLYLITKVALPSNAVSVEYQAFKTGGSYGSAFVDGSGTVVKFLPKTDVTTGDRVTEAVPSGATWFYHMWDDPAESDKQTAPAFTYIRVYTEGEIETPEGLPVRITEQTQDNNGLLDTSTGVWTPQTYPAEQGGQTVTVCSIPAGATTVNYQMFKTGKTYGSGFFNGSTFISGYANNTDAVGTRKTLSIPAGAKEFWHMYPNRTYANGDGNCPEFDYIEFA